MSELANSSQLLPVRKRSAYRRLVPLLVASGSLTFASAGCGDPEQPSDVGTTSSIDEPAPAAAGPKSTDISAGASVDTHGSEPSSASPASTEVPASTGLVSDDRFSVCADGTNPAPVERGEFALVGDTGAPIGWITSAVQGPLDTGGRLVTNNGALQVDLPVAGPGAIDSAGHILVVGGPTAELVRFSTDDGQTWAAGPTVPAPDLAAGYDFGWWSFGAPGLNSDGAFLLPAIWNQTPPDRSVINRVAYDAIVSSAGDLRDLAKLDYPEVLDDSLFAVAVSGRLIVIDAYGGTAEFDPQGQSISSLEQLTGGSAVADVRVAQYGRLEVDVVVGDDTTQVWLCFP